MFFMLGVGSTFWLAGVCGCFFEGVVCGYFFEGVCSGLSWWCGWLCGHDDSAVTGFTCVGCWWLPHLMGGVGLDALVVASGQGDGCVFVVGGFAFTPCGEGGLAGAEGVRCGGHV